MSEGRVSRERLPPRALSLLYFGFAYLCLGAAFLILMLAPRSVAGFFYQPRMLAVVHLVTLGWISASILGALYLVGPIALRTTMVPGKGDYLAWGLVALGVTGMVTHFWIGEYNGMVWSAVALLAGTAYVGARAVRSVLRATIPGGIKLHITLAVVNVLGAGLLGVLLGIEKQELHVLPGYLLHNVYAHAHLAALGWGTMMVMGTAYRLFPMVLPAAMPRTPRLWLSAVLLEAGLLGLVISLPFATTRPSAPHPSVLVLRGSTLVILCALAVFGSVIVWMKRHPKPSPRALPRPDFATLHVAQAVAYLVICALLGAVLAFAPPAAWKLDAAVVYGVFGLVGFLGQMVIGIAARILPMFAWMHAYVGSEFSVTPPSQYTMHSRPLQVGGFVLWTLGVPLLAWGLASDGHTQVAVGAAGLLAGLACNAVNGCLIVRHAFAGSARPGSGVCA